MGRQRPRALSRVTWLGGSQVRLPALWLSLWIEMVHTSGGLIPLGGLAAATSAVTSAGCGVPGPHSRGPVWQASRQVSGRAGLDRQGQMTHRQCPSPHLPAVLWACQRICLEHATWSGTQGITGQLCLCFLLCEEWEGCRLRSERRVSHPSPGRKGLRFLPGYGGLKPCGRGDESKGGDEDPGWVLRLPLWP